MIARRKAEDAESGFSLIELLVYIGLAVVVLAIVGGFLINSLRTSHTVSDASDSTTAAQLISTSIQSGVRNASAVTSTNKPDGSQLLLVRTATRGADLNWVCQAWYYSAPDHAVYTTTTNPAAAIVVPSSGPAGSWTLLGTGVSPIDSAAGSVFSASSAAVALTFAVSQGGQPAVQIHTDAYLRTNTPESGPCFAG